MVQAHVHSILPKDDLHCMHNRAGFWYVIVQVSVPIIFYLTYQLGQKEENSCYPFDLNHSCIFLFHSSLIFLLGKKNGNNFNSIFCFSFLDKRSCWKHRFSYAAALQFIVLDWWHYPGTRCWIWNSELINDVKDDRNLKVENASIIHPCTFWGFSFQSLPATRTQFLWKRIERLVNLLLEWMAQ